MALSICMFLEERIDRDFCRDVNPFVFFPVGLPVNISHASGMEKLSNQELENLASSTHDQDKGSVKQGSYSNNMFPLCRNHGKDKTIFLKIKMFHKRSCVPLWGQVINDCIFTESLTSCYHTVNKMHCGVHSPLGYICLFLIV